MARELIKLKSTASDEMRWTTKKKGAPKLRIKKFDSKVRRRVDFVESK
ncbi:50S ribosomal protein L33 [Candidatus Similichlamydia epinepheli]|nr:50S ribosomal protein L33 [Candidatus Similichlamydia epinepheli]